MEVKFSIVVDDEVVTLLQEIANSLRGPEHIQEVWASVQRGLEFGYDRRTVSVRPKRRSDDIPSFAEGTPVALSQTLHTIYLVRKLGYERREATHHVAFLWGVTYQTVISKYTTQLDGLSSSEVDRLLQEPTLDRLRSLLERKFVHHRDVIEEFFQALK